MDVRGMLPPPESSHSLPLVHHPCTHTQSHGHRRAIAIQEVPATRQIRQHLHSQPPSTAPDLQPLTHMQVAIILPRTPHHLLAARTILEKRFRACAYVLCSI